MGSVGLVQGLLGRTAFQGGILVCVLLVLTIVRRLRRRGRSATAATVATSALAITVIGVIVLTLRPFAPPGSVEPRLWLNPLEGAWGWAGIAWGPVIDNVALFVPLGAFAVATWWQRSALVLWFGCIAMSVTIEAAQYLVPTGRVANTADVLANATGAMVGVLLGIAFRVRPRGESHRPGRREVSSRTSSAP